MSLSSLYKGTEYFNYGIQHVLPMDDGPVQNGEEVGVSVLPFTWKVFSVASKEFPGLKRGFNYSVKP